jgi:cytochrome oxidase Cu insertion factor (SCO1/SenC/PrrC family)
MSGSSSSAPDVAEPLGLTVHSLPAPAVDAERTRRGRLKMLLVLLACAAPVIASYFTYFVIRPQARSNYGTLIQPTRAMPELGLRTLAGERVASASLKGQWLLVLAGPAGCDAACEKRLFLQRQLREMLGRERDRVDKLWLVTDGAAPAPALVQAAAAAPAMSVLQADAGAVAAWLQPEAGRALPEHLYVVDPMGEWMMRMPADADPQKVKRDLERLLRASAGWDKAGR